MLKKHLYLKFYSNEWYQISNDINQYYLINVWSGTNKFFEDNKQF